jgi:hypothetical protein
MRGLGSCGHGLGPREPGKNAAILGTTLLPVSKCHLGPSELTQTRTSRSFPFRRAVARAPCRTIHTGAQELQDAAATQEVEEATPSRGSFR